MSGARLNELRQRIDGRVLLYSSELKTDVVHKILHRICEQVNCIKCADESLIDVDGRFAMRIRRTSCIDVREAIRGDGFYEQARFDVMRIVRIDERIIRTPVPEIADRHGAQRVELAVLPESYGGGGKKRQFIE